jgi:hypothetical protein
MQLPRFLIIGAAKCGTTSLYHQLNQHPQVYLPAVKEPTFFSEHGVGTWDKGLDWYRNLFANAGDNQISGEASTSYTKAPWYGDAAAKIHQTVPDVKLIYMVRDPVDQIISHYEHMLFAEQVSGNLTQNLMNNDFLIKVANYKKQIALYAELFPRNQILVLVMEHYVKNNSETFNLICDFLGIDRVNVPLRQSNARRQRKILKHPVLKLFKKISKMSPNERQSNLPEWMLKPQAKVRPLDKHVRYIHDNLADGLLDFADDWQLDINDWKLSGRTSQ